MRNAERGMRNEKEEAEGVELAPAIDLPPIQLEPITPGPDELPQVLSPTSPKLRGRGRCANCQRLINLLRILILNELRLLEGLAEHDPESPDMRAKIREATVRILVEIETGVTAGGGK